MDENKETIKIEVKLDAIRREVWWLSTFLVKIPLVIGAIAAVFWLSSQKDCSNSSQDSYDGGYDYLDADGEDDEAVDPVDGDGGYDYPDADGEGEEAVAPEEGYPDGEGVGDEEGGE
jgi:hypothetical protein